MARHKKPKKKLTQSLTHAIRKAFTENKEVPLNHKQVCALLNIKESALRKLAYNTLEDLSKSNFLKKVGHSEYLFNSSSKSASGSLQITSRGSGYVILDGGEQDDVFIAPRNLNQALGGDRVRIRITKQGRGKPEGEIIEVLERERVQFVGTIQMHEKFAFLVPDNSRVGTDLFIPKGKTLHAKNGDKAIAKITSWPKTSDNPYGEILEVLGSPGGNDVEMISILVNQGINYTFPEDVLTESESLRIELDEKEITKRRDFRGVDTFTIDPLDAKDFDDALSYKKLENGHIEIGIHIADVSHYVRQGSPMDEEALKRSNSVYLVDRVVPMLPEQLSNLVCSLRPNEDKFSFSAVFEIDDSGKVYNQWFGKTVIHSNRRFTYEEAQEIIEGKDGDFVNEIRTLDKIAKKLRKKRLKNGAMNIESTETRFRLDDTGHPIEVVIKTSKDAHKLVEEFMLLANKKVAIHVTGGKKNDKTTPFIFRCHDKPSPEKISLFTLFVKKFGYDIDLSQENSISQNINALLDDIRYKNEYSLIQTMAIRSMAKATYETTNIGHYGLAFDFYTHFTSPIRRYADLVVHRILQEKLLSKKISYGSELNDICRRVSQMERKAVEAERESTKFFQTLFVIDKVGEVFEGTVSGVAEFGLFVKMTENQCEGLVLMNEIPGDRYFFDSDKFAIVGSKTKKEFNFGDPVKVKIYEVSIKKRQIDLELVVD